MVRISSYVFFDIETTGLPWQEKNRTKITELCLLATAREEIENSTGHIPPVSKLTLVLNPQRKINPEVSRMTGLTNEFLRYAPTFQQKSGSILNFLYDLPKPVCLVAHNGNTFDYKIFLAECMDAGVSLPDDILCIDSLGLFRKILKPVACLESAEKKTAKDHFPDLNISPEDWDEIDKLLCSPPKKLCNISFKDCIDIGGLNITDDEDSKLEDDKLHSYEQTEKNKDIECLNITNDEDSDLENKIVHGYKRIEENKLNVIKKLFDKPNKNTCQSTSKCKKSPNIGPQATDPAKNMNNNRQRKKGEFTLSGIYKRLLNKEFIDAHRAENDCFALLECIIAKKGDFLPEADNFCRKLSDIKPLQRY